MRLPAFLFALCGLYASSFACELKPRVLNEHPLNNTSVSAPWQSLIQADNSSMHLLFSQASIAQPYVNLLTSQGLNPVVTCSSGPCSSSCDVCLDSTWPDPDQVMTAAAALLRNLSVRHLILIFDSSNPSWNLEVFAANLAKLNIGVTPFHLNLLEDPCLSRLKMQLTGLAAESILRRRHFAVLGEENILRSILVMARNLIPGEGLLNRRFFWMALGPVTNTNRLRELIPTDANLMFFKHQK